MNEPIQEQILKLQELQKQMQLARGIPVGLLQSKQKAGDVLKTVREIGEASLSESVQGALHRAEESLAADGTELGAGGRREKRKTRVEQVEAYVGDDRGGPISVFPPLAEKGVRMEGLHDWARQFNHTASAKLRIGNRVLRLTIPDVLTAYMGLAPNSEFVQVETIRVFGPRETQGGAHGQSKYRVFQQLSQQLARVLEDEREVKLQSIVGLLAGYAELFVARCRVCGRVVSGEGHVPAVVRRWTGGGWVGEHVGCAIGAGIA